MADQRERQQREAKKTSAADWAKKQAQGYGPAALKLPDGVKLLKLEEGTHQFDIMPFRTGEGNPNADPDFEHFERQFTIHKIPRPDGNFDSFLCTWESYGQGHKKPCVICQYRNNPQRTKEEADALRPQLRRLFLVNDKPGDAKNPVQILNAVHYNRKLGFGEQLVIAINATRGGTDLADLKRGLTVQVMVADSKYGSVSRIDLLPRDYEYSPKMLDRMPCLDDCLVEPDPKAIQQLLDLGGDSNDGGPAPRQRSERPSENGTRGRAANDDDEEPRSRRRVPDKDDEAPAPRSHARPAAEDDEPQTRRRASGNVDEAPDEDDEPTTPPRRGQAAAPLKAGSRVEYKGTAYTVLKVSADGTLTLEDDVGDELKGIPQAKVKPLAAQEPEEDGPEEDAPQPPRGRRAEPEDDDDPPRSAAGAKKSTGAGRRTAPAEDDDEGPPPADEGEEPAPARRGRR